MWHGKALAYAGAAILAAAVGEVSVRYLQRPGAALPASPPMRVDRQGALCLTDALYRAMSGQPLQAAAVTADVYETGRDGAEHVRWRVEAHDRLGRTTAVFVWDARNEDLLYAPCESRLGAMHGPQVETPKEAAERAWYWMQSLGLAAQCREWRLHQVPTWSKERWAVRWDGAGRWARVCVAAGDGACTVAHTSRLFDILRQPTGSAR